MSTAAQKKVLKKPVTTILKSNKMMSKKNVQNKPSLSLIRDERIRVKNILLTIYNLHQEIRGIGDYKMSYVTPVTTSLSLEFKNGKHATDMSKELMKKHGFMTSLHNNTITINFTNENQNVQPKEDDDEPIIKKKQLKTNDLSKLGGLVSKYQTKKYVKPIIKPGALLQKTKPKTEVSTVVTPSFDKEPYELKRDAILAAEQKQLEQLRKNAKAVIQLVKIKFGLGTNRKGNTEGYSSGKIMTTKSQKFYMKFPTTQLAVNVEEYLRNEKYTVHRNMQELWIDVAVVPVLGGETIVEPVTPPTTESSLHLTRLEHITDNLKQVMETSKTSNLSIPQIGGKIWDYMVEHNILVFDGDRKIQIKDLAKGLPMDYERETFISLIVNEALK